MAGIDGERDGDDDWRSGRRGPSLCSGPPSKCRLYQDVEFDERKLLDKVMELGLASVASDLEWTAAAV